MQADRASDIDGQKAGLSEVVFAILFAMPSR
jgi:hypothetical protein